MEEVDMSDEDLFLELRERGRSVTRTPTSQRRRKHAPPRTPAQRGRSRSRGTTAKQLSFRSPSNKAAQYHREAVSLLARPQDDRTKFDVYHLNKGKSLDQIDRMWLKRNTGKYKLKTRKVRHKNARSTLKRMPRGGKPYARGRKSMKKPQGAYRGAVLPRWAKGETKHVLIQDGAISGGAGQVKTDMTGTIVSAVPSPLTSQYKMNIGDIQTWSLNPIAQGTNRTSRNGASVDGTYLRIQGHIHNVSIDAGVSGTIATAGKQRCYARMIVLAVKGSSYGSTDRSQAAFSNLNLFKKIDGSIAEFATDASKASDRVRTLQLDVNKQVYTKLADRKFELSGSQEGFGASDRLFDMKIPIKQKTSWRTGDAGDFEKNQLVLVVMTVDPNMNTTPLDTTGADSRHEAIQLEFESKYSYKDF